MARKHINNGSKSRRGNFSASPRCRYFKNVGPSTQSTYEKEFNIIFSEVGPISIYYLGRIQITNTTFLSKTSDFQQEPKTRSVWLPRTRVTTNPTRSNFGALRHELRISSKCHKPASKNLQTWKWYFDLLMTFSFPFSNRKLRMSS